jgi:hypothetical protein
VQSKRASFNIAALAPIRYTSRYAQAPPPLSITSWTLQIRTGWIDRDEAALDVIKIGPTEFHADPPTLLFA